jgi:asparagine synthase (glutamine-hydrolysing)
MCGIAGALDLVGKRVFAHDRLQQMLQAIAHRGPDDEQVHVEPGVAIGACRLAIIDVAGGRQPMANENGDVWVAFEGELYDYSQIRDELLNRGHRLRTRCDTEAWVHLYEEQGEQVFEHARGQFASALWDRSRQRLLLGRDRAGIAPLYYTQREGWLLWASEAKALFASGMVRPTADVRGLDYFFNFFCMPTERTCFEGVRMLPPGHFLRAENGSIDVRQYWDLDFPDRGAERRYNDPTNAAEQLEDRLRSAVRRRLVGEVPLACYLSGGLDSSMILQLSSQERGSAAPSFTVGFEKSGPVDERTHAAATAQAIGSQLSTINVTERDIAAAFPRLIAASEGPVLDTSAACMILLAEANRSAGNKIALSGEGADELLAGYVWFKWNRRPDWLNRIGAPLNRLATYATQAWLVGGGRQHRPPFWAPGGVRLAQQFSWEIMAQSRETLYSSAMWDRLDAYSAHSELPLTNNRIARWDPLNQSLYAAFKVMMPGLLLHAKGDRAVHQASTEGRYPFLDEDVVDFCSQLAPSYKLRGWSEKWLLRQVAARVLPTRLSGRRKTMFRAHMGRAFLGSDRPTWVDELLSPESLRATGYFDPQGVERARQLQLTRSRRSLGRFSLDMGLAGVISTQLWHHQFLGGGLADLPVWSVPEVTHRKVPANKFSGVDAASVQT